MKKRAITPVIATVLLISISLILAVIIVVWARSTIVQLNPQTNPQCEEIYFNAEILNINNKYYLAAVNLGNINITSFQISVVKTGAIENRENIKESLSPGESKEIQLTKIQKEDKKFLIIPANCPEKYGVEAKI